MMMMVMMMMVMIVVLMMIDDDGDQGMKTHPTMRPPGRRKFLMLKVLQEIFQNIPRRAQHLCFS